MCSTIIKPKCSTCECYVRKIEEVEQDLSGKEIIISVLQKQFAKCNANYQRLFDEFEQLRFEHGTALQNREINAKLEEHAFVKNPAASQGTIDTSDNDRSKKQSLPENQRLERGENSLIVPNFSDDENINKLVKSVIFKDLIEKVLDEHQLKNHSFATDNIKFEDEIKQTESGDHIDTDTKTQNLEAEINKLKSLVNTLEKQNDSLSVLYMEEKEKLTQYEKMTVEIACSCIDMKNEEVSVVDTSEREESDRLRKELTDKQAFFEQCSCHLIEQVTQLQDSNQSVSDTLAVMTAENKNNVEINNKLKEELARTNHEYETKEAETHDRIIQLETLLEQNQIQERKLKDYIELSEKEAKRLNNSLHQEIEKNKTLKSCSCEADQKFAKELAHMEETNAELSKELADKSLELAEYEEENRSFCQKIDVLANFNSELSDRIKEMEAELLKASKECQTSEIATQMSLAEIKQCEGKLDQLTQDHQSLNNKYILVQKELADVMNEEESLKCSLQVQLEEILKLNLEKDKLDKEIGRLKKEYKSETARLQGMVNKTQNQVEMLLKEHDEKTSQIQTIANELDNIRLSVTEDKDGFMDQIKQMEKEKEVLKKIVDNHQDCLCTEAKLETERLKAELIKKNFIILELEKSVDDFNDTLKHCDETVEKLACENKCLKVDAVKRLKDFQDLQQQMVRNKEELDKMRQQLVETGLLSEKRARENQRLYAENQKLEEKYQDCLNNCKKKFDLQDEKSKNELGQLRVEKGEKEKMLVEIYQLQMEMDSLKKENERRQCALRCKLEDVQQAYDELKKIYDTLKLEYDQRNKENENIRDDLRTSSKATDVAEKAAKDLQAENDKLKKQLNALTDEVQSLREESSQLKRECDRKCIESQRFQEVAELENRKKRKSEQDNRELMQNSDKNEKENALLRKKLEEMQKSYEEKTEELKKIKKQYDSCAKHCQITREEYTNLRKEYKEIKTMLSDQITRYRTDIGITTESNKGCSKSKEIQMEGKDQQIMILQQKLKDATYEIIEMKDYIHKLICDNNILKSAINNLISNLENKIKGPSFRSLSCNSTEAIAGDILQSLTDMEEVVIDKTDYGFKNECHLSSCLGTNCDCMRKISSQYNQNDANSSSCGIPKSNRLLCKLQSEPLHKLPSETTTTDSEDPQNFSFLNEKCLSFFKDTIQDLKTHMDHTMKEKCCDCEK